MALTLPRDLLIVPVGIHLRISVGFWSLGACSALRFVGVMDRHSCRHLPRKTGSDAAWSSRPRRARERLRGCGTEGRHALLRALLENRALFIMRRGRRLHWIRRLRAEPFCFKPELF